MYIYIYIYLYLDIYIVLVGCGDPPPRATKPSCLPAAARDLFSCTHVTAAHCVPL